jgi:hypothetical protein
MSKVRKANNSFDFELKNCINAEKTKLIKRANAGPRKKQSLEKIDALNHLRVSNEFFESARQLDSLFPLTVQKWKRLVLVSIGLPRRSDRARTLSKSEALKHTDLLIKELQLLSILLKKYRGKKQTPGRVGTSEAVWRLDNVYSAPTRILIKQARPEDKPESASIKTKLANTSISLYSLGNIADKMKTELQSMRCRIDAEQPNQYTLQFNSPRNSAIDRLDDFFDRAYENQIGKLTTAQHKRLAACKNNLIVSVLSVVISYNVTPTELNKYRYKRKNRGQ